MTSIPHRHFAGTQRFLQCPHANSRFTQDGHSREPSNHSARAISDPDGITRQAAGRHESHVDRPSSCRFRFLELQSREEAVDQGLFASSLSYR